ncbi:MAG: class II aldolase/adducin family protein [Nocardioidaceae bacterium]|nr:class II aldolase/adducin family protein [Nocardioidaceae bacterium]
MEKDDVRRTVAQACRVLALAGLTEDILGHVSVRVDDDTMLLRCRGPHEQGLLHTTPDDVREVRLDGTGDPGDGYRAPHEASIHAELLRARPEVRAVVHAHPRHAVLAELAGLPLRPVFGAYHIPAYRLAVDGVPVYPRSVLVSTPALGRELAAAMGESDQCMLHGHGIAVVGTSVQQAVLRALALEELARWTVELTGLGASPPDVPPEDRRELPDLGIELNDRTMWRHHLARLERAGLAVG